MRKSTINLITIYLIAGVILNAITMYIMLMIDPAVHQVVLTVLITNLCIIQILRMIAIKQEQVLCRRYSDQKHTSKPHIVHNGHEENLG